MNLVSNSLKFSTFVYQTDGTIFTFSIWDQLACLYIFSAEFGDIEYGYDSSRSRRTIATINNPSRNPIRVGTILFTERASTLFRVGRETLINAIPRYNANPSATIHQYTPRDEKSERALGGGEGGRGRTAEVNSKASGMNDRGWGATAAGGCAIDWGVKERTENFLPSPPDLTAPRRDATRRRKQPGTALSSRDTLDGIDH